MDDIVRRKDVIDALRGLAHRFEDPEDWCILEGEAEFVVSKLPSAQPLTDEDYIELHDRFGTWVEEVVRDMISGEGKRWETG